MRKKPEILAPAGSLQGLKAAVAAGCDAVYIGGKRFGARAYADNPERDELLEAIAYCHLHHVRFYLTVNTLLKNRELNESLFSYLKPYYEAGLDAVIVQDVGALRFISRHFPSLPVHASTQMTLTQGKAVRLLEQYHVSRIVPARELSLDELRRMRHETEAELEVFVHGALCYCYSGQCLFSSMLGGRSGNRGRCAQPCRQPYFIEGKHHENGDYLLSPKELCNLPYLPELVEAGVDSFKIEGRMKRPEYTAFVTAIYRKYVDFYFSMGKEAYRTYLNSHLDEWKEDMRQLAELYNREGFTQGYLEGNRGLPEERKPKQKGQMLAQMRPKHGGVCVGKVLSVSGNMAVYRAKEALSEQDVVEFRDRYQRPSYEYTLGRDYRPQSKVMARYQKGSGISAGDMVYRTKDAALLKKIREAYLEGRIPLPVSGRLTAEPGKPATLQVSREGFKVTCSGPVCQKAEKQKAAAASVEKVLRQTGGTDFYFQDLELVLEGEPFLPNGVLKKMRRQALELLAQNITGAFFRSDTIEPGNDRMDVSVQRENRSITAVVVNQEQLSAVLQSGMVSGIYLQTEQMDRQELREAYRQIKAYGKKAYLVFPAVFRIGIWERYEEEWKREDGFLHCLWDGYLIKNMESLVFLTTVGKVTADQIILDQNMYVMNQEAYCFWREQGITQVTLPLEATGNELAALPFLSHAEMQIYGRVPLMVSAQCIGADTKGCVREMPNRQNKNIYFQDRKGRRFLAVNCCKYCYNIIYQEEPVFLAKKVCQDQRFSKVALRYCFTTENEKEVLQVLRGNPSAKVQSGHFEHGVE